jgi:hypothetical protein
MTAGVVWLGLSQRVLVHILLLFGSYLYTHLVARYYRLRIDPRDENDLRLGRAFAGLLHFQGGSGLEQ